MTTPSTETLTAILGTQQFVFGFPTEAAANAHAADHGRPPSRRVRLAASAEHPSSNTHEMPLIRVRGAAQRSTWVISSSR